MGGDPTRSRYDRIAPVYDLLEWLPERGSMARWRACASWVG